MTLTYRKVANVRPGLIEVRRHFCGLIFGAVLFGRSFGLMGDLCMPENLPFGVQAEKLLTTFIA